LGNVKTDTIILYVGEKTINRAIEIVVEDAQAGGYGYGEPTLTSNPHNGTFGQVIGELLSDTLNEGADVSNARRILEQLLALDADEWTYDVIEPLFMQKAREMFGSRLYLHNLAFIDKG